MAESARQWPHTLSSVGRTHTDLESALMRTSYRVFAALGWTILRCGSGDYGGISSAVHEMGAGTATQLYVSSRDPLRSISSSAPPPLLPCKFQPQTCLLPLQLPL